MLERKPKSLSHRIAAQTGMFVAYQVLLPTHREMVRRPLKLVRQLAQTQMPVFPDVAARELARANRQLTASRVQLGMGAALTAASGAALVVNPLLGAAAFGLSALFTTRSIVNVSGAYLRAHIASEFNGLTNPRHRATAQLVKSQYAKDEAQRRLFVRGGHQYVARQLSDPRHLLLGRPGASARPF